MASDREPEVEEVQEGKRNKNYEKWYNKINVEPEANLTELNETLTALNKVLISFQNNNEFELDNMDRLELLLKLLPFFSQLTPQISTKLRNNKELETMYKYIALRTTVICTHVLISPSSTNASVSLMELYLTGGYLTGEDLNPLFSHCHFCVQQLKTTLEQNEQVQGLYDTYHKCQQYLNDEFTKVMKKKSMKLSQAVIHSHTGLLYFTNVLFAFCVVSFLLWSRRISAITSFVILFITSFIHLVLYLNTLRKRTTVRRTLASRAKSVLPQHTVELETQLRCLPSDFGLISDEQSKQIALDLNKLKMFSSKDAHDRVEKMLQQVKQL